MQTIIQQKMTTVSTGKLAAISVVGSLFITACLTVVMSLVTLGKISVELLIANSMIGIIVPSIVAPFVIQLLKKATNLEHLSNELQRENTERKRLEEEARQKARDMQAVSELAIECAAADPGTDLLAFIAEKLLLLTHALGVGVTTYDPNTKALTVKHIAVSGQILASTNQLVGHNLIGMITPVDPGMYNHMIGNAVDTFADLSEITFGTVAKPIAITIKKTLGVGSFTGLALSYGGELIGTAIIALREDQPPLAPEVARTLASVAAVSIQRKRVEDALRESENKFRTIVENLSEGFTLLDEQGTIIEWNPSQEKLTGIQRDEALGKPAWDIQYRLVDQDAREANLYEDMKAALQSALQSEHSPFFNRSIQGIMKTAYGETKHISQTSFPIQTNNGFRIGAIIRDVTSQKKAEADRETLIAELKSKNAELERFTYTVSHDLKSPIITIKGFLGLLEKDVTEGRIERTKSDMARIMEATDKMQNLLGDLLELSRIGRIMNPSQAIPFEKIAQEAITAVNGRLESRGVQVNIEKDLPTVFGDPVRLMEVVQNLVENAAKFMGNQSNPRIEIGSRGVDNDGKPIFFVKDNGIGIAPQHHESVFGLFHKLDVKAEGTGVGLALVKRIVETHNGRIWIESDGNGTGSTFYFTLPAQAA